MENRSWGLIGSGEEADKWLSRQDEWRRQAAKGAQDKEAKLDRMRATVSAASPARDQEAARLRADCWSWSAIAARLNVTAPTARRMARRAGSFLTEGGK